MSENVREIMPVKGSTHFDEDGHANLSLAAIMAAHSAGDSAFIDASDLGTGFEVLTTDQKDRLVGVPLWIADWRFNSGDMGEYVTLFIVTEKDEKYIINDGSTGILRQMKKLAEKLGDGNHAYVRVPRGLTASEYIHEAPDGKRTPATTYYISFSK